MKKVIFTLGFISSTLFANKIAVIKIKGMTCPLCTVAIKHSLKKTSGVIKAKVKLNTQKATVVFKEDTNSSNLLEAIKRAGYEGKILNITSVNPLKAQTK